jgi:short-subunit dehydrogenase
MRVKAASADKPGLLEIEIMQESFLFKAQPFKRNDGLVKDVLTRRLKGKSALITGASRGVGREIALMLAPYEMRLGLLARSREELDKLAEEIKKFGSQAIILAVDLTERPQIEQAVALFAQKAGAPDFLVNNAGIGMRSYWEDITLEKELAITGVNYLAPLILMRLILPMMLKRKSGQIININTVGGLYAAPYQAAYCASKAAFLAYATSLAHELEGSGVYISNLFPGPIDTEFLRRPNYESFRDSKEVVPAGRVASEVMAVIARPRERVFIGPAWRHLAVKLTNLAPCLFRRIIESKNSLPLRVKKKDA